MPEKAVFFVDHWVFFFTYVLRLMPNAYYTYIAEPLSGWLVL